MKNLITLISFFILKTILFSDIAGATTYYVSTTGNDANPGTITQPWRTFQKIANTNLSPGDIVYIRAGTYMSESSGTPLNSVLLSGKNGNSSNWITIAAYPGDFPNGGRVVFDCSDYTYTNKDHVGIRISNSSYLKMKGIRVKGIPQTYAGQVCIGWWVVDNPGGNITLEDCEADHLGHTGFRLDATSNTTFLNCDAHHIDNPYDPGVQRHGGSDGFGRYGPANTSQNTVYKGCRAWFCSDDGWDAFGSPGNITYDGCWAFWNGYVQDIFPLTHSSGGVEWGDGNGFKLGSNTTPPDHSNTKRFIQNCAAFENYSNGFDQNLADVKMQFYNNTVYKCNAGFFVYTEVNPPIDAKNNLVYQCNRVQNFITSVTTQLNNIWNGNITVGTSDFTSLNNSGVDGARKADGSMPVVNFLRLNTGSKLIDAGTNVGLSYNGNAPDLGAFEYGGAVSVSNQSPTANAGSDQSFSLPTTTVTLNGSGTDPDGSIASYQWAKISGPTQFSIASTSSAKTDVSGLAQGVYQFELKVTDNKGATGTDVVTITVKAPANQLPVANAGTNKTITLPSNSVTLDGSTSKDADGSISSYLWSKVSGPSQGSITSTTSASTTATNLAQGTYIFKLTVTDNSNATGSDSVIITVNALFNQIPVVNAGANQTITLPASSANLNGSATDADGTIASYVWSKTSGPSQGNITNTTSASTTATNLVQGTYVFKLVATDNGNANGWDSVIVTVNAATNKAPVADAGTSQTIKLPVNSVTLNGSASSDPDGTIVSYSWVKSTGGSASIANPNNSSTIVNNLQAGQYIFELTVTDNKGASSKKTVKVTVVEKSQKKPVANAGSSQRITLPENSVTLDGTASLDPDSVITSYTWSKIKGPGQASIANSKQSKTTVNDLVQGIYSFQLTVIDNEGNSASDTVEVTVNAASNQSPIANAGLNQTLPFGTESVTLDGSASNDPDGTIKAYKWSLISGATVPISDSTIAKPVVKGLKGGQYIFELTVTDDKGATATAQVKVIVSLTSNQPPIADAGANQVIVLPVSSAKLDGTGSSDPDGSIAYYNWVKVQGPSAVKITNVNTATPVISDLTAGQYTFKLTVTDNRGASTEAEVKINVQQAANQPPVADAGGDLTISLPNNNGKSASVRLDGTKSYDSDGNLVYYTWKKIDGPSSVTIDNVNTSSSVVSGLQEGQYTFELTVTDNDGSVDTDRIIILVKSGAASLVADAGEDLTINTPESTVKLDGSRSHDSQGNLTYKWEQVQGPGQSTIVSSATAVPTVSNLVTGVYTFKLTVTNRAGATASDEMKVIVVNAAKGFAQVDLYPNPATDVVNAKIMSDSIGVVILNIYDVNGRAVKKIELNKQLVDNLRQQVQRGNVANNQSTSAHVTFTLPVNITSLGKGVYILETIIDQKVRVSSKFLKY